MNTNVAEGPARPALPNGVELVLLPCAHDLGPGPGRKAGPVAVIGRLARVARI
jgi:hypothetical protein